MPQDSRTASAAFDDGESLARFDVAQLRLFRNMVERHVARASSRVVIASAPSDYVDEDMIAEFITHAGITWADAKGLVGAYFNGLSTPLYDSIISAAISDAADYYQTLLPQLVDKRVFRAPIFGEFLSGNSVQYGDVRPLLVRVGGGSPEPTMPSVGGVTSGITMREWMRSNGIDTNKKIWLYGYEDEPRRVFNGHLQMDGLVFEDWNDDALLVAPQDAWLRSTHYFAGDHTGCACVVSPYVPNFGPEFVLDIGGE